MPRQQIVDRVVKDANDDAEVLNNTQYMVNQQQYEPNWNIYPAAGDVDAANAHPRRRRLDARLRRRAPEGQDVKLAFTVGTTSGNQARILSEQIMQQQLEKIGVKLTIKNSPNILDVNMTGFDFETLIFAWVGGPDPYTGNVIWQSIGDPGAVLEATGQGLRVRLLGPELHQGEGPAGRHAAQRGRQGSRPGDPGGALQPGRPAARHQRRDRDPAVPEADAARVPQHDQGPGRQPDPGRLHLEHRGLDLHAGRRPFGRDCRGRTTTAPARNFGVRASSCGASSPRWSSSSWRRSWCSRWCRREAIRCGSCGTGRASRSRRCATWSTSTTSTSPRPRSTCTGWATSCRATGASRSAASDRSPTWSGKATWNTLLLVGTALVLSVMLALFIGVVSAVRQYSLFDHAATSFSYFGFSMPDFFFALAVAALRGRRAARAARHRRALRAGQVLGGRAGQHRQPDRAHGAAGDGAHAHERRRVEPLPARQHARGAAHRLRAHRHGEGRARDVR